MENRESATGDASNAPSMTTPVSTESPIHPSINSSLWKHHLVDTSRDSSQLSRYSVSIMSPEIKASMSGTSAGQSSSKKARTDSLVMTHFKVASLIKTNEITNAAAIMGMQGLINHLTDILE